MGLFPRRLSRDDKSRQGSDDTTVNIPGTRGKKITLDPMSLGDQEEAPHERGAVVGRRHLDIPVLSRVSQEPFETTRVFRLEARKYIQEYREKSFSNHLIHNACVPLKQQTLALSGLLSHGSVAFQPCWWSDGRRVSRTFRYCTPVTQFHFASELNMSFIGCLI